MNTAFSVKNPIITLENVESEDGQNVQKGYMMMFAGAMIAIRNPKAHSNDSIEPEEAMPLIQIASRLFGKFESAVAQNNSANKDNKKAPSKPGVYVWIDNPDDQARLVKLKNLSAKHPGSTAMILVLGEDKTSAIRMPFMVSNKAPFITELKDLLGKEKVVVK